METIGGSAYDKEEKYTSNTRSSVIKMLVFP
jgi:hypothetical protein